MGDRKEPTPPPEQKKKVEVQTVIMIPHRYYRMVRNAMFVLGIMLGASIAMVVTFVSLMKGGYCP